MKADIAMLEAARALIAKPGGWCQGTFGRSAGGDGLYDPDFEHRTPRSVCAIGAIAVARRERPLIAMASPELYVLADALALDSAYDVVAWNDGTYRTASDIIDAFDDAIDLARSQEASS